MCRRRAAKGRKDALHAAHRKVCLEVEQILGQHLIRLQTRDSLTLCRLHKVYNVCTHFPHEL